MKHQPKPDIEQHFHIEELINRQEKRSADKVYHQNRIKTLEERESLIKDNKVLTLTDFWCDNCKVDFKSQAIKQVEVDWTNTTQTIAFYKTKCFCGKWCMRLITDRHRDAFWFKSTNIARDRGVHYADTLQPFETGFNLLYGKQK